MTSYIASVQSFEITIANGSTSNTATITSVDTTKSVIFFSGFTYDNAAGNLNNVQPRVELTNGTTVTAIRSGSTNGVTVRGMVVEFTSSTVSSVQQGTITIASSSASNTATISSVTTTRSAVFFLGNITNSTGTAPNSTNARLDLTNATTVTATRESTTTSTVTVGYCVVEFQAAAIQSVQQRSKALTSATTTGTDTISSITTSNAMLVNGGFSTSTSTWASYNYYAQITGSTAVTLTRTGTATSARTVNYTIVEFVSGVMTSVQRGNTAIASVTSADTTVTSVDTTRAVLSFGGFSTTAASATQALASAKLFNATTVRGEKGTAGLVTSTAGWELIEFAAGAASYSLTAGTGGFSLTGNAANLLRGRIAAASVGSFTLSGVSAGLSKGYKVTASVGSYTFTGQGATLNRTRVLQSAAGVFTLSGKAASPIYGRLLGASAATFTLTGQSAGLLKGKTLTAGAASYTLTGQSASLLRGYRISAAAGSFALTGQAAGLTYGGTGAYVMAAGTGSFNLSGNAATLTAQTSRVGGDPLGPVERWEKENTGQAKREERERFQRELERIYDELHGARPEVAAEAKEIIAPFAPAGGKRLPPARSVDFSGLARKLETAERLLALHRQLFEEQLRTEEEEAFFMLLAA